MTEIDLETRRPGSVLSNSPVVSSTLQGGCEGRGVDTRPGQKNTAKANDMEAKPCSPPLVASATPTHRHSRRT